MRCFTQDKIVTVDGQRCFDHRVVHLPSDPECEHVTEEQLLASLITYTCDVPNFDMQAMDFSEDLINVPEMRFSLEDSNLPASLQKYLGRCSMSMMCRRRAATDCVLLRSILITAASATASTSRMELQAYAEKCPPFVHDHRADEFLTFDPVKSLTCVKARMGSGKTQNLTRILTHEQPNSKVVMISCRRTLAFDFMKRYQAEGSLPFESYLDIKEHDISVRRHPRLIIQIDSLGRIIAHDLGAQTAEQKPIDFLILDEVESLLNQLKSANNTKVVQVLRELMVLCGCPAERIEFNKDMPEHKVRFVQTVFKQSKENRGLTFVTETIAKLLAEGKRVACFMSIRKVMESVKAYISETMPDINIMTFSGKDKEMEETETEGATSTNMVRNDIRLFMYTSTITAGVDINVPHFDTFVHVLSSNMNPIETAQAIFRVRNYKQRAGIIAYQRGNGACDTQTLEQLMALGNTVESAFACGRCNWTLPQQVLAMLGARHTELVSKAMEFIVSALKQHHYTLEFTDLVKPEITPVALAEQHMDQRIITLLGWEKSAEGVWDQHRTWAPAPEELAHLGQQNDAAHLVTCTDPYSRKRMRGL
ncbi:putative Origin of replication binding protein [Paratrimastix pyriformis]|uniref:Origin of replication binding protein n=1 Tax=Paratrimastix pyriformis TaxID=342808 RepID=A0ABQ8US15_9EUKA|nr:putative Origin of replication binding protein [Paratrimastix pyriformis]